MNSKSVCAVKIFLAAKFCFHIGLRHSWCGIPFVIRFRPRGTVRLFDQIKMKNPEHAGAFYYAARDTLVAQTIDEARRVALHGSQRWRVVTVGGQLIEISGTMSGGGSRVARGLMSNKNTEEFSPAQVIVLISSIEK